MGIEVLGREAVDSQNNQANQAQAAANAHADIMEKSHMLKYYIEKMKVDQKLAGDEIEKAKLDRIIRTAELGLKVFELGAKQETPEGMQNLFLGFQKMYPETFPGIMRDGFQEAISKMTPSAESRLAGANIAGVKSLNEVIRRDAGLSPTQEDRTDVVGGVTPTSATNATNMPIEPGAAQGAPVGPPQGRLGLSGITQTPTGMSATFSNPERDAYNEGLKTTAREKAKNIEDLRPVRNQINNYLSTFADAVQEIGGLKENAIEALASGKVAELASKWGNMPATFTLQQTLEPTALLLGSQLNKGRPTEPDKEAGKLMLTRLTYTRGVNQRLAKFLNDMVNAGDKNALEDLYWAMAYDGSKYTGKKPSDLARAYGSRGVNNTLKAYGYADPTAKYKFVSETAIGEGPNGK